MMNKKLYENAKKLSLSLTGTTADGLLQDSAGNTRFYIGDVDWKRIVGHFSVDAITGTSVTFKVLTSQDGGKTGATTDLAAVKADGSTAFASASLASATKVGVGTGKMAADGSAATNIGDYISVLADIDTTTEYTVSADLLIEG